MAEKQVPLSIVLRTVDKATAGINAVNKRLDAITKPARDFGKALGELKEKSGLDAVMSGFRGVGSAIGDLLGKVAIVGGVVALAVHGVLGLVEEFDNLGDTAEKLGVTVDFLAAMRFAAERSGASVESLDEGLTTFGQSMGQLRAGGGRMLKFLQSISPALVTQLKATKGNEAAFRLLADAMAEIKDPQKRLALAANTVGSSLAPMLARGSKGLLELQGEFVGLAGSMEDGAEGAGQVDDELKNLKASSMGVKAAIVKGLAPALTTVVKKLTEWFVAHREDVAKWATEIGERLPGAVDRVVSSVRSAIDFVTSFVKDIGGVKVALAAFAAVMAGPLIEAFATLSIAMLTTPFGLVLTGLAAVTALVISLTHEINLLADAWDTATEKMLENTQFKPGETSAQYHARLAADPLIQRRNEALKKREIDIGAIGALPGADERAAAKAAQPLAYMRQIEGSILPYAPPGPPQPPAKIIVDFRNAPSGMRVTTDPRSPVDIDHTVGYQLGGVQ